MDSSSSQQSDIPKPKRLKTLASNVKFSGGNVLLHQFVLDNSHPNESGSEMYVRAVLLSMSDIPASAVNALNDEGFTALHLAVLKQNLLLVNKLLSCLTNIDVNAKGGRGDENTALHFAVVLGYLSIVQELFNKGASIDIRNTDFETALSVALRLHDLDIIKILVGADVNQHTSFGTPLSLAARFGRLEIAEFLIDQGADIDARDGDGLTPLHDAASRGHLDVVKLLVGKGADLHATGEGGVTPLHEAAGMGNLECVAFLLDQGAHLNAVDIDGLTPLHDAAWGGEVEIMRLLLEKGADARARDIDGRTSLDLTGKQSWDDALQTSGNNKDLRPWFYFWAFCCVTLCAFYMWQNLK